VSIGFLWLIYHHLGLFRTNLLTLVEDTVEGCWIGARARAVSEIGSVYSPPRALPGTNAASQTSGGRHVETIVDVAYRERVGLLEIMWCIVMGSIVLLAGVELRM
jgi:hypothetical protein